MYLCFCFLHKIRQKFWFILLLSRTFPLNYFLAQHLNRIIWNSSHSFPKQREQLTVHEVFSELTFSSYSKTENTLYVVLVGAARLFSAWPSTAFTTLQMSSSPLHTVSLRRTSRIHRQRRRYCWLVYCKHSTILRERARSASLITANTRDSMIITNLFSSILLTSFV